MFLCVSRTLLGVSLVMVVCHMLCSVGRSNSPNVLNYNFNKEQYMLPEDDRVIEAFRRYLNVLMQILDFLNYIYMPVLVCVCVCVIK